MKVEFEEVKEVQEELTVTFTPKETKILTDAETPFQLETIYDRWGHPFEYTLLFDTKNTDEINVWLKLIKEIYGLKHKIPMGVFENLDPCLIEKNRT